MCRICALQDRGELWITDTCLLPGCAHTARTNTHLDDIGTAEDELLRHLLRDYISSHDGLVRVQLAHIADALDESFGVSIRHIDTNHRDTRNRCEDLLELLHVLLENSTADSNKWETICSIAGSPCLPLVDGIVFMNRSHAFSFGQDLCDLEGAHCIHIRSDDRNTCPALLRVRESKCP